jgi:hypothetical protein
MTPSSKSNSPVRSHFVNIGWACCDRTKKQEAIAYAIDRASFIYTPSGDVEYHYGYYKTLPPRNVTRAGLPSLQNTGYGRINVMFCSHARPGLKKVSELKSIKGSSVEWNAA